MEYQRTIDEYRLELDEFFVFKAHIEAKNFRIPQERLGFEFTEATSIVDEDIDPDVDKVCGRVIDNPWGFGNKGLHVFRGSRLEGVVKEYFGLQDTSDSSVSNSWATRV